MNYSPIGKKKVPCVNSLELAVLYLIKLWRIQKENHEAGNKFIGYVSMAKQLTEWRNCTETPWLYDAPCHSLQHALKDLDRAYKNFFAKRANFPRFKRERTRRQFSLSRPYSKSNSIRTIAASSCQNSAGSITAKAEKS